MDGGGGSEEIDFNSPSEGPMQNLQPPTIEPFNYRNVSKRQAEFMVGYIKAAFGIDESWATDPEQTAKQMQGFMTDAAELLGEVKRLYDAFDSLKRKHMPHPGEPGAPVKYTACSLHGAEVLWPCETYKAADSTLPEGWPL